MHWRFAYLHYRMVREKAGQTSGLFDLCLFFGDRLFELATAVILIAMSFHLVLWPQSIGSSSLRELVRFIDPSFLSLFFGIFGGLRLVAIVANGMWPVWGPWIRAAGALAGALVFGNMAGALYQGNLVNGVPPSLGIPVYCVLAFFELLSMYRALVMVSVYKWKP